MENNIEQFISNPENVLKLIDILNSCFKDLHFKYTIESLKLSGKSTEFINSVINNYTTHDAESFYRNGHCLSYSEILNKIFENYSEKYNSDNHIIVKIGNYFYDVLGLINEIDLSKYHKTEMNDLYYFDIAFGIKDKLEMPIEKELIQIGKEELDRLITKFNSNEEKQIHH